MTSQDFAQVKAATQTESGSDPMLNVVGIVVIAGLCFSCGYWLGSDNVRQIGNKMDVDAVATKLATQIAENRLLQVKNATLQHRVLQWKTKAKQGAHTKVGELTFYKELPEQSVTPAPVPDMPKTIAKVIAHIVVKPRLEHSTEAVKAMGTLTPDGAKNAAKQQRLQAYRIQLASFRTKSAAMVMQRKLTKAGFMSRVQMADLGRKGYWYRLYAGPYDSKSAAERIQKRIDKQLNLKGFLTRGQ